VQGKSYSMWIAVTNTKSTSSLYLRLLCRFEPQNVLEFLKTNDSYDLDECLEHCRSCGLNRSAAFLLERKGDLIGSYQIYVQEIQSVNTQLIHKDDSVLEQNAKEVCDLAIALCVRSCHDHLRIGYDKLSKIDMWSGLLACYVDAYQTSRAASGCSQSTFLDLMELVTANASSHVDTFKMIDHVLAKFEDSSLKDIKDVLKALIGVCEFEEQTSRIASNISKRDCVEGLWSSYFKLTKS
jgi:hypothetical protein